MAVTRVSPGVSRDRVPVLAGRCDPLVERAIRDLYLRFYKFNPVQNITQLANPTAAPVQLTKLKGTGAYTIVFTIDGLVGDDQKTPSFTVNKLRDGFTPLVASLTADFAPGTDLAVNFLLDGVAMLSSDLTLPAGQLGPVTSSSFALSGKIGAGSKVRLHIVSGGGAGQVVGEVVMKSPFVVK